jgi:hypothetical protein
LGKGASDQSISSAASTQTRFFQWAGEYEAYAKGSTLEKVLGLGIVPGAVDIESHENRKAGSSIDFTKQLPFVFDCDLPSFLLFFGAAGVFVVGWFLARVWLYEVNVVAISQSPLQIAIASALSTVLLAGTFNNALPWMASLLLIAVVCQTGASMREGVD